MRQPSLIDKVQDFLSEQKDVISVKTFHEVGRVTSTDGLIVKSNDGSTVEISFYVSSKGGSIYPCRDCGDRLHSLEELQSHRTLYHSKESTPQYYYLEIVGREAVGLYRRDKAGVMPRAQFAGTVIAINRFQYRVLRECELDFPRIPERDKVDDVKVLLTAIEEGKYVE
jgi:hypothetical protein